MSLSQQPAERRLLHRRAIDVQVFARQDGCFDVEASLQDTKPRDFPVAGGMRSASDPLHAMRLLLCIDAKANIIEARSETHWMPYPGACDQHGEAYGRLVGLNLFKGFRQGVKERLGGTRGCTHITELCQVLPTAVVQAFVGVVIDPRGSHEDTTPPFQLDRCHALRRDGESVKTHFPRWYRATCAAPAAQAAEVPSIPS